MNENGRSIVTFTMVSHAIVHTYELSIPILVVIWLTEFSLTTATIGTIVAVGYALFGMGALPSGILVDRYSTKLMVLIGLAGMGASFLLLSVAQGTATIALALGLWGVFASGHHPAALSLISTGVSESGTGFAYHGMAGNLGIAFGPFITASLLIAFDWRIVSVLLVVPAVLAIGYAFTAEFDEMAAVSTDGGQGPGSENGAESDPDADPLSSFLADSKSLFTVGFTLALVIVLMNGLFYRGALTFLPEMLGDFLPAVTDSLQLFDPGSRIAQEFDLGSYLYAGLLTVGIAGQYAGGKLTDRIPVSAGLAAAFAALAVVSVLFVPVAAMGLAPLVAVSALFGFALFTIQPLYQATIAEYSPPDDRGLSYGYTYLANFGVGATGAAIAGYLLGVVSIGRTFLLLALVPTLGALLAVVLYAVVGEE